MERHAGKFIISAMGLGGYSQKFFQSDCFSSLWSTMPENDVYKPFSAMGLGGYDQIFSPKSSI